MNPVGSALAAFMLLGVARSLPRQVIGCFSAASNATGLLTDVDAITRTLHQHNALAVWDYAAVAPYAPIVMNPVASALGASMLLGVARSLPRQVIGCFSAASNATGVLTDVDAITRTLHQHNALAVWDYAAAAPYAPIVMNPVGSALGASMLLGVARSLPRQVIGCFSAASNATGVLTDVDAITRTLHQHNALAVWDYAAAAPYAPIVMNPVGSALAASMLLGVARSLPRQVIGCFSAASNATGVLTDVDAITRTLHQHKALAVWDYAAAAPYAPIVMNPVGSALGASMLLGVARSLPRQVIGCFSAASNATGVLTDVDAITRTLHQHNALAVWDYAAAAPYAPIVMNPVVSALGASMLLGVARSLPRQVIGCFSAASNATGVLTDVDAITRTLHQHNALAVWDYAAAAPYAPIVMNPVGSALGASMLLGVARSLPRQVIGCFSAASNATGVLTDVDAITRTLHQHNALAVWDYAAAAPYAPIVMNPVGSALAASMLLGVARSLPRQVIGCFSAASNATGVLTDVDAITRTLHQHKALAVWDYAAAAPYAPIVMNPVGSALGASMLLGVARSLPRQVIGCFSAASNATGVLTDVDAITRTLHQHNALAVWDYAAAAPYAPIVMNPVVSALGASMLLGVARSLPRQVIGCFSAASNATGVLTDVDAITRTLHQHNALAVWDYAAAAPYAPIVMNPVGSALAWKDAIFFSGHKFVGGPQSPGVLVAKKSLFRNPVPYRSGGGTVFFVKPDGGHSYLKDAELREEGGSPESIGAVRLALAVKLKDAVTPAVILRRHDAIVSYVMNKWQNVSNLTLLGPPFSSDVKRLAVFSFVIGEPISGRLVHHNAVAAMLDNLYGIQSRAGCLCAGPYVQRLLGIDAELADRFENILREDPHLDRYHLRRKYEYSQYEMFRPGVVRLNVSYHASRSEMDFVVEAVCALAAHAWKLLPQYRVNPETAVWHHVTQPVFRDRKWLGRASFVGGQGLVYHKSAPDDSAPSSDDCLRLAERTFADAATTAAKLHCTDGEAMLDEQVRGLRWFLFSSEAQAYLLGKSTAYIAPPVFTPKTYRKASFAAPQSSTLSADSSTTLYDCDTSSTAVDQSPVADADSHSNSPVNLQTQFEVLLKAEPGSAPFLRNLREEADRRNHKEKKNTLDSAQINIASAPVSNGLDSVENGSGMVSNDAPGRLTKELDSPEHDSGMASNVLNSAENGSEKVSKGLDSSKNGSVIPCNGSGCDVSTAGAGVDGTVLNDVTDDPEQAARRREDWSRRRVVVRQTDADAQRTKQKSQHKWHSPPARLFKAFLEAVEEFALLRDGDRVLVCLSGGKDSLSLLHIMRQYQFYARNQLDINFELGAITVDPGSSSYDPSPLIGYLTELNITYLYEEQRILDKALSLTELASICSFCSRMKRGRLYASARLHGWNVLALGHHLDDLAESFLISAFYTSALRTMKAHYTVSEGDLRVIRPLCFIREKWLREFAEGNHLPIIPENCPACFDAPKERYRIKQLLANQEVMCPNLFNSLRSALRPIMAVNSPNTQAMNAQATDNILRATQNMDEDAEDF